MTVRTLGLGGLSVLALACTGTPMTMPDAPKPGPLRAGTATVALETPVGTPLGGYGRSRPAMEPGSAWAALLPSSRGVHTEPTARAVAFTDGVTQVAMVRLDGCLTSPTLFGRVTTQLQIAGVRTEVLIYATHSHAAPARYMPPARVGGETGSDFVALVMDPYDAEVESRIANAIVRAATEALSHTVPVHLGVATGDGSAFNNDRRCENDPLYGPNYRDTAMTVVRIDEVDEAGQPVRPVAALMHYAVHGTSLGSENTLMSSDAPGAIELYASDALGIPVMYVQGAAGDVSPKGSPFDHDGLQGLERQGRAAATVIADAWRRATPTTDSPTLRFIERGVLMSREAIGYSAGAFPEGGGIGCGSAETTMCGAVRASEASVLCVPLGKRRPIKTNLSLFTVGDVAFISLPGEPSTAFAAKVVAALAPVVRAKVTLPVGYAQDHFGYLLEEDDWLRGGYEPTVSPWGWKLADYLLREVKALAADLDAPQPLGDRVRPLPILTARPVIEGPMPPAITLQPVSAPRLATHTLTFVGGDPGLGLPQVALEREVDGAFTPVMASERRALINGPEIVVRVEATPSQADAPMATSRTFRWTAELETIPSTPLGRYRLVARGRARVGGVNTAYRLESQPFTVTASEDATYAPRAVLSADGVLRLSVRFPPNPTLFAVGRGDVIGNYRLRDATSKPADGARVRGGQLLVTVSTSDVGPRARELTWSEPLDAWSVEVGVSNPISVTVAERAVRDAFGNTNATAFTVPIERE